LQEEGTQELQKQIQSSLKIVAKQSVDVAKAGDFLHKLHRRTTVSFKDPETLWFSNLEI
jgi:hypothetical protein